MKRFFTFLIFAILLGSSAMASDFSAECSSGHTLYYNISSDTEPYTVTVVQSSNYQYLTGELVIPESVEYNSIIYIVTSIESFAFLGCNGLTSVSIPNSVTSICRDAFEQCIGLTSVTIGNSVTSIGNYAFSECIGLTSITIPNSVTNIGEAAFYRCFGLTSVTIGNSVTNIDNAAFCECSGLTSIVIDPDNQTYDSRDNCNAIIKTATNELLYGCNNTIIPNSITTIGDGAFSGYTGLTSVTIPNSVTSIGESAFSGCSGLTTVNFNATNCTTMGSLEHPVFASCSSLAVLTIGENVSIIPDGAFGDCALDSIISAASNPPIIYANTFDFNSISNIPVVVPCGAVETYNNADFWYSFRRIQQDASCPAQYTITVLSNNPNYGTVTGGGVYLENATATLTATPYEEHIFVSWNDGSTDNPREITVTGDSTFIATFVRNNINPTIYTEFSASACGNYTWNGIVYTESGDHIQTFTAANSADSIVTLHLTVHSLPQPEITVDGILDACNPETTSVTLSAGDYSEYNWNTGESTETITVTEPRNYYVEVVDGHGCHGYSEMLEVGYSNTLTEAPQLKRVGMSNTGTNIVQWTVANTEGIAGFEIYREDNVANVYTLIQRIDRPGVRSCTDLTANPSARAYRYKICAVDECGGLSPLSEPHKTMHLTINRGIGNTWNLIWSPYEGMEFASYKIYRGSTIQNMVVIGEVPSTMNTFTDSDNPNSTGFFYKVVTVANTRSDDEDEMLLGSNIVDNGLMPEYTITAVSANPNQGTVVGGGTYPEGSLVALAAIPTDGYEFLSWSDESTDNPHYITVTGNAVYVATFVPSTDIKDNALPEIALFPNPATDILNITSSETISEIEIVNTLGQVVYRTEVNTDNAVCDVNGLANGVYVVKIHGTDMTSICQKKFVKE